jgi:hypothetical protein
MRVIFPVHVDPRPLSEIEARWLLPRIRSTRRALRIGWLLATWVACLGGFALVALSIYGLFDGEWEKSLVLFPVGLLLGAIGVGLPSGRARRSETDDAPAVGVWRGHVKLVRVRAGKSHTYIPTLDGERPLLLPPGWGDEVPEGAKMEFEAVEVSTPGLHGAFDRSLYVVAIQGRRSLEAELAAGLGDDTASTLLVAWLLLAIIVPLFVLPLELWPTFGAAYDLRDVPELLRGREPLAVDSWQDLQAADPRPGSEIVLGAHLLVDWRTSEGQFLALPDSAGRRAFEEGLDALRARMEAVRALRTAEAGDPSGALHRRLDLLAGNPAWETFEAEREKVLRSWTRDPSETAWSLGWLRSELFRNPHVESSFVDLERRIGDALWSRVLLQAFGLRVSIPGDAWFEPEAPRRAWLQGDDGDQGPVVPTSLPTDPDWSEPQEGQLWTRWSTVEGMRQVVRPGGIRAVVRRNALGNDYHLVSRGAATDGNRRYLLAVFGIGGGSILFLWLGWFLHRRHRGRMRRCAAASRAHWEARR